VGPRATLDTVVKRALNRENKIQCSHLNGKNRKIDIFSDIGLHKFLMCSLDLSMALLVAQHTSRRYSASLQI
jgi:hypothetical protein